jgi:hypothetical protein
LWPHNRRFKQHDVDGDSEAVLRSEPDKQYYLADTIAAHSLRLTTLSSLAVYFVISVG